MSRPKNIVPAYKHHKPTDTARCWINGEWVSLGKYNSPESRQAHARLCAELASAPDPTLIRLSTANSPTLTIDQILLAFWRWATTHYRTPDGQPTTEIASLKKAVRRLRALYGQTPAAEFGPKKLAAVRQKMVEDGLSRGVVNRSIDRVRRVFKWATAEELIPVTIYQGLRTLSGLRAGRTEAPDHEPVKPVDPSNVDNTLPHLNRHLRAMVGLQRLTGMRPAEVCKFSLAEVSRSGEVWLYQLSRHKTTHHGKKRVIPLGPRARALITSFITNGKPPPAGFEAIDLNDQTARLVAADAYQEAGREKDAHLLRSSVPVVMVGGCVVDPTLPLFSPREAREARYRAQRANRKSRVPPSQVDRSSKNPKRVVGSRYTSESYAHAVQRAVEKAGLPRWHPNQIRHLFATEVRSAHGLEAAQVLLGHSRADVTQVYAERNLALAVKVAEAMG